MSRTPRTPSDKLFEDDEEDELLLEFDETPRTTIKSPTSARAPITSGTVLMLTMRGPRCTDIDVFYPPTAKTALPPEGDSDEEERFKIAYVEGVNDCKVELPTVPGSAKLVPLTKIGEVIDLDLGGNIVHAVVTTNVGDPARAASPVDDIEPFDDFLQTHSSFQGTPGAAFDLPDQII